MVEFNDTLDQIITEAVELPKLSQTSIFQKFDEISHVSDAVRNELKNGDKYVVKPSDIEELIAIMKLNGSVIVKKAIMLYQKGDIIIINNKETSQIPAVLPYIVTTSRDGMKCYIFADKIVSNIKSTNEFRNLMAVMEAAYLALQLSSDQKRFTMNAQLILSMCDCWWRMVIAPMEAKMYMKGDNLTKASMYTIAFFYKMIHGQISVGTVPFNRFLRDKIEPSIQKQIIEDINQVQTNSFFSLLECIKKINPVRYKDIDTKYITYFTQTCGINILFSLENLQYLFLLMASAIYKTPLTGYSVNKIVQMPAKRAQTVLINMNV